MASAERAASSVGIWKGSARTGVGCAWLIEPVEERERKQGGAAPSSSWVLTSGSTWVFSKQ